MCRRASCPLSQKTRLDAWELDRALHDRLVALLAELPPERLPALDREIETLDASVAETVPTGLFSCPPLVGDDPAGILRWVSSATVGPRHDGFIVSLESTPVAGPSPPRS